MWRAWRQERLNHDLMAAIRRNDTQSALAVLDAGADANAREKVKDMRPLWSRFLAVLHGKNTSDNSGSPALLVALEPLPPSENKSNRFFHFRPENTALVSALLRHGADMHAVSENVDHHDNALQWAACSGKAATIKLLAAQGTDLNSQNNFGNTPLMEAVWNGQEQAVQMLVDLGADVNLRDNLGITPLQEADEYEMKEISRILRRAGTKK